MRVGGVERVKKRLAGFFPIEKILKVAAHILEDRLLGGRFVIRLRDHLRELVDASTMGGVLVLLAPHQTLAQVPFVRPTNMISCRRKGVRHALNGFEGIGHALLPRTVKLR